MYTRALGQERRLRSVDRKPTLEELRAVIRSYEAIVRRHPSTGYSDNALWQAGNVALLAYERFGQAADKRAGVRLLAQLKRGYPTSSLVARVDEALRQFELTAAATRPALPAAEPKKAPDVVALRDITRTTIPDGVRVTIEMDAESRYRSERLEQPRRLFFDLAGVRPIAALQDATLKYADDVVREIRLGRHPRNTTRVVVDMEGVDRYSVFTLYNPFRLVIDFQRSAAGAPASPSAQAPPAPAAHTDILSGGAAPALGAPASVPVVIPPPVAPAPVPPTSPPSASPASSPVAAFPPLPAAPAVNSDGKFSIARQLGLGISRVVIDAGHGGHDPGARANGLNEAELVLDVALRLGKLLQKQPGIEVVMTRDRDVYIPLEERTAIANQEGADLFLSIHANASRNTAARGVETYFLNFATNPEAEAVAARENAASGRTMNSLPEIVRAIALNNKIDESRDFAAIVQRSMVRRLATKNRQLKDLGVKQAPFVVLIGAGMPSVLAEISFVTHRQEAQLLKTAAYRQQIADALLDAVMRYQQSLKKVKAIAAR
jgi:N-acetylmuramoyl-L-alanine amidase